MNLCIFGFFPWLQTNLCIILIIEMCVFVYVCVCVACVYYDLLWEWGNAQQAHRMYTENTLVMNDCTMCAVY